MPRSATYNLYANMYITMMKRVSYCSDESFAASLLTAVALRNYDSSIYEQMRFGMAIDMQNKREGRGEGFAIKKSHAIIYLMVTSCMRVMCVGFRGCDRIYTPMRASIQKTNLYVIMSASLDV